MKYPLTLLVVGACCMFVLRMQQFQVHNITRHYLTLNYNSTHNNLVADSNGGNLEEEHPLSCVLKSHPKPMILMSLGRSGTSSMYSVLSKLSGGKGPQLLELTGSSTEKSEVFFREIIPKDDVYGDWLLQFICREQIIHPDEGLVGFKWKPYKTIHTEEKSRQGLKLLSRLKDPQIKVIRSRRNLLDVVISRHKHSLTKELGMQPRAHCQNNDEKCFQKHKEAAKVASNLPTRKLLEELTKLDNMELRTDSLLDELSVPTINVSFERLFMAGDDVSEWKRLFKELGVGPTVLTARMIEAAGHASTSITFHNVTLSNYEEVREALNGTKFASFLH